MKRISWVNPLLFLTVVCTAALAWCVPERDVTRPNYEFLPEAQMAQSPAYDTFAPNPNFADGLTLRTPPVGTIARGHPPLDYQPTLLDALRAGLELPNPYKPTDTARRDRGMKVFTNYCQVCHGPLGQGNGPVTQGSFPPPASLLADRAVQMKDGHMFHVLTYGQGNMPSFAAQLSRDDRWSVILHVRMLQGPLTPGPVGSRSQEVAKLFGQNCAACHGMDGTGANVRNILPLIPDFTSMAWQMSQTEMAIVNQIDYGSAPLMPAWRYKLKREEVLGLAVYIRSFAGRQPAGGTTSHLTAKYLYGTFCYTCHDTTGKGMAPLRASMPDLPDFTAPTWQKSRKDADLAHSILDGKGKFMLPMKDKLGTIDVNQMVALIRGFDGGKQTVEIEPDKGIGPVIPPVVPDFVSVDARTLSATVAGLLASSSGCGPLLGAATLLPAQAVPPGTDVKNLVQSDEDAAKMRIAANIFRTSCFACHGNDGKGAPFRPTMPQIPDFTSKKFHEDHTDAQIRVSILDGKGTLMQPNRGRITEQQAGYLVAYIRAFGHWAPTPASGTSDAAFIKAVNDLELQLEELHKQLQKTKDK